VATPPSDRATPPQPPASDLSVATPRASGSSGPASHSIKPEPIGTPRLEVASALESFDTEMALLTKRGLPTSPAPQAVRQINPSIAPRAADAVANSKLAAAPLAPLDRPTIDGRAPVSPATIQAAQPLAWDAAAPRPVAVPAIKLNPDQPVRHAGPLVDSRPLPSAPVNVSALPTQIAASPSQQTVEAREKRSAARTTNNAPQARAVSQANPISARPVPASRPSEISATPLPLSGSMPLASLPRPPAAPAEKQSPPIPAASQTADDPRLKIGSPTLVAVDHREAKDTKVAPKLALAQQPATPPAPKRLPPVSDQASASPLAASPFESIKEAGTLKLTAGRPTLLRMKADVYRTMVVDNGVCEIVRITARDVSLSGKATGRTHVTFFYEDQTVPQLTYLVEVQPDAPK
jgi:hypothetical protein